MEATLLRWLDVLLGLAEVVLLPAVVGYLAVAVFRPARERASRALTLAGIAALTVAQPFGVKGEPITPQEFAAGNPKPAEAEAIHSVRVLGVPLFGFRPYRREVFTPFGDGGYEPHHWLKVRSWLWPGILTNGSKVMDMCGDFDRPCWVPEGEYGSVSGQSSNLELVQADGEWRYHVRTPTSGLPRYPDAESSFGFYRLEAGVASRVGLIYWIFLPPLAATVILSLRRRGEMTQAG